MIYYIGDTHFGHANVIKHDNRPFRDVDEMDRCLIRNWQKIVHNDDDIYILGDFAFRNGRDAAWYLEQLPGKKHLIIGNHDKTLLKNKRALAMFESIDYMKTIYDADREIILCHYPMASWDKAHYGTWHVFAHIHNNMNEVSKYMFTLDRAINAGCMLNHYMPATFNQMYSNYLLFKRMSGF